MTNLSLLPAVCLLAAASPHLHGTPEIKVEILQPFDTWLATEKVDFYVRLTNMGKEPLMVNGFAWEGLFIEGDPEIFSKQRYQGALLEKVENANLPKYMDLPLPPGRPVLLSDLNYNDGNLSFPEMFPQARAHLLVASGVWLSSDWTVRKILPVPDLTKVEPLFEYELDPMFRGKPLEQLRPVKIAGETWLCVSLAPAYVRRRLCRVPEGITPKAFSFDQGAQRLTIRFDGGEEEVVINTRTGAPLTGSERTVPHLHLWKKLSGRPFTDVWQNTMDAMKRREQQEAAAQGQPAPSETGASDESIPRRNGRWLWLALGALVLGGTIAAALRWRRGSMRK